MLDVKYLADTKIADSKREFELQKAAFSQEVNTKVKGETIQFTTIFEIFSSFICVHLALLQLRIFIFIFSVES